MVAYICPLYDMKNHFNLGKELAESKLDNNVNGDLYFVFSDVKQQIKFFDMLGNDACAFKYLIIPNKYCLYKSIVTAKKFYALERLMNEYDYLVTLDSESRFIRNFDSDLICETIWNNHNTLVANKSYDGFFIQRVCYKTMDIYNNKRLKEETEDYLYNIWFNEIPVYKSDSLIKFFNWLNKFNIDRILNEWLCFDYYIFAAYLIIEEGWTIKKINRYSFGGINEYLFKFSEKTKILNELETHWTSDLDSINENICIVFHLDRINDVNEYADFSLKNKLLLLMKRYLYLLKDKICNI